jgi:LPXTG-motif cell wall-anchored protein
MKTGTKVVIGAGLAAALIGGAVYLTRRRKRALELGAADGPAKNRIGDLQDAVWEAVQDGQMRELAIALTSRGRRRVTLGRRTFDVNGSNCEPRDGRCEAGTIGKWVSQNDNIARASMQLGSESSTALACALISLNGVPCRFRAARQRDGSTRVYSLAGLPKLSPSTWPAVDASMPDYSFGRELPRSDFEDFDG